MEHTKKDAYQGYFIKYSNVIKLKDEDGLEKATKQDIVDFFVCKIYGHNAIYHISKKIAQLKVFFYLSFLSLLI